MTVQPFLAIWIYLIFIFIHTYNTFMKWLYSAANLRTRTQLCDGMSYVTLGSLIINIDDVNASIFVIIILCPRPSAYGFYSIFFLNMYIMLYFGVQASWRWHETWHMRVWYGELSQYNEKNCLFLEFRTCIFETCCYLFHKWMSNFIQLDHFRSVAESLTHLEQGSDANECYVK